MTKILALLLVLLMVIHVWKPLGIPGLKRRQDVWKIAAGALAIFMVTVLIRP